MSNKMLIDAAHPEETRVVVLRGDKVEEFDFESAERRQLRGNIYLAKVTRVEPSLQAAFVDYGGNRHGFLAFSEIHPDYYQIPFADRQALLDAEESDRDEDSDNHGGDAHGDDTPAKADKSSDDDSDDDTNGDDTNGDDTNGDDNDADHAVESVGAEDAMEEVPERRRQRAKQYKIQEVIKRRQVLLVQVVKEERGNKGAALTTYLSLAGRYSVLMPNTGRGGGISRKITDPADRKRLKSIAAGLEVPSGMGVILRTAGASRTKTEIKRDFEYLLRLWENVRDLTLKSAAPTLVYEEGSLVKRSIRDLYSREIDQVMVAGEEAYREAKDFMRMLMPSHAKNVQPYRDAAPIFSRHSVERQLEAMFLPQVTLRSGGYIVINQTEALVAIDVNSGRSTREHSIEDTAVRTNLEAAEEVARQLRLRDLAGLIVIDFIDMEEKRNNRAVERKLKDCLRFDRARIQLGRISHFGLMEMSRQRLRTGVLESSTALCHACHGTGQVRSVASLALQLLRMLEEHLIQDRSRNLEVSTRPDVALYVLNQKRSHLADLERRFAVSISVAGDAPDAASGFTIDRADLSEEEPPHSAAVAMLDVSDLDEPAPADVEDESEASADEDGEDGGRRGGRRRKRRRPKGERAESDRSETETATSEAAAASDGEARRDDSSDDDDGDETKPKKRRRGRRGGRRRGRNRDEQQDASATNGDNAQDRGSSSNDDDGDDDGDDDRADARPSEAEGQNDVTNLSETSEAPSPEQASPAEQTSAAVEAAQETAGAEASSETTVEQHSLPAATEQVGAEQVGTEQVGTDAASETKAEPASSEDAAEEDENRSSYEEAKDENADRVAEAAMPAEPEAAERGARASDTSEEEQQKDETASAQADVAEKAEDEEPKDDPNRPKRVGWWQRRSFL
ncbi:ribonuclease E/G [Afifella marina]|uniref:Ribonuclease E n=1 Tax=Afifella marina DSM 2698 TaxID=1120955 RepID=A0A1G5NKN8_AFIMA|nr:ribonuclease E/G [Afifella marina]MBK1623735.1 ribonuclease E/G [Afifella marina DSM 2698]MBK1626729.1 ribonuclease E/G [Afifella marina]MBK5916277.1 ribonuclease E/G [Afifella marina]RAI21535.1 ribonuclease E/G [Afifella marina DSM 2698]SCZ37966.1 ribonuclease E [Afifella marina DSM 2698]